jgi:hypothetical protein
MAGTGWRIVARGSGRVRCRFSFQTFKWQESHLDSCLGVPSKNLPWSPYGKSLRDDEWAACKTPDRIIAFSGFTVRPLLLRLDHERRQNTRTSAQEAQRLLHTPE